MSQFDQNYKGSRNRGLRGSNPSRGFGGSRGGRGGGRGNSYRARNGEECGINICRHFITNSCKASAHGSCGFSHVVSLTNEFVAAPSRLNVNFIVQWQETNIITATDEGCIKMWSTLDGKLWNEAAKVELCSRLPVKCMLVVGGFIACGYESSYSLSLPPDLGPVTTSSRTKPIPKPKPTYTVGFIRMINLMGGDPASFEVVIDAVNAPYAHPRCVNCLALGVGSAGEMILFSGGDEGRINLWRAQGGGFILGGSFDGHVRGITSLINVGHTLWSASNDFTIRVWNTATMMCMGIIGPSAGSGHLAAVNTMIGPLSIEGEQGEYIVTGSSDKTIRVWNSSTGEKVHENSHHTVVTALASFKGPTGPLLLIGSDDGSITLRDFPAFVIAFELSSYFCDAVRGGLIRSLLPLAFPGPKLYFMAGNDEGKVVMWTIDLDKALG